MNTDLDKVTDEQLTALAGPQMKIPKGYCQCGCGQRTTAIKNTIRAQGRIKGEYNQFIHGHNKGNLQTGSTINDRVVFILAPKHPNATTKGYVREHILVAEKALGKLLPPNALVHHMDSNPGNNSNANLIVCEDQAYHQLLHRRERALKACGHAHWLKCRYCKQYDDPENLTTFYDPNSPNKYGYHMSCNNEYLRQRRVTKNLIDMKEFD